MRTITKRVFNKKVILSSMPEELTEDEQYIVDVDCAKAEIRKNLLELGRLVGQEDARQIVEGMYPFTAF